MAEIRMTYQYRLYDNKQNKHLDHALEIACEIWNHCIALHRRYYRLFGKHLSDNKLKVHLTKLKKQSRYTHWNDLGSQAIQDVAERIGRSYKAFFDHVKTGRKDRKSPPKFYKKENYSSFTLKQAGYKFHENDENGKINCITIMGRTYKYIKHRSLEGKIKTLTVKRTRTGEYYICISVIRELPEVKPRTGNAVGLDFGMKQFLTTDNGEKVISPEWYKASLKELRKAHRKLSGCQKGSNNRKRAKRELSRIYEKIPNRIRDWFFKLANELTGRYEVICIEDLNLDAMKHLWGKKVSDLSYAEFLRILEWVAKKNGSVVVKIDRWYPSSKTCHVCGTLNMELTLDDRTWRCACCGTELDRDQNAAINIREAGLAMLSA